jgi:hypothetical protein
MIKHIIDKIKVKAIEDDNKYWEKQKEWIQRKDCHTSFGENLLFFSLGLLTMSIIKLII